MTKMPSLAFLALLTLAAPVHAADDPAPPAPDSTTMSPADAEKKAVLAFGTTHEACTEWTDACVVCVRSATDAPACSLPGIACLPKEVVCKQAPDTK